MNDPLPLRLMVGVFGAFLAIGLIHVARDLEGLALAKPAEISKYEEQFIAMDKEAIVEAYKRHIIKLYDIWVTDYDPKSSAPPRAVRGAINARGAYTKAMEAIEEREEALHRR